MQNLAPTAFVITHESDPNRTRKAMSIIALTLTRSLGRRGIKVIRLHPNMLDHSLRSKYVSGIEVCPNFYEAETDLVAFLMALEDKYEGQRVLFPASDDCAHFLAKYQDELSKVFSMPIAKKFVMEQITDKKRQYEAAQCVGLPIPETYFPKSQDEVEKLADEIDNYPYVIKPTVAHEWRLASMQGISKGKKALTARNVGELREICSEIDVSQHQVMVQEVIGGRDERLYTFLCYFNERSEPLAYCVRSKIRQSPIDFGYCTLTVSCHDDTVVNHSISLLRHIKFHGIASVEWKHDPKTGKYKLIEINPRPVNTTATAIAAGVDLPYIALMDKIGQPVEPITDWEDGVKWIWFSQDFFSAREMHRKKLLTFRQWKQSISGKKTHATFAADDLRPFLEYFIPYAGGLIRSKLRAFL